MTHSTGNIEKLKIKPNAIIVMIMKKLRNEFLSFLTVRKVSFILLARPRRERRGLRELLFILGLYQFFCLMSSIANAGEVSEALNKKFKAQNDYYVEVKKLGPNVTPQQERDVKNRTINPANREFHQAMQTKLKAIIKDAQYSVHQNLAKSTLKSFPEKILKQWKEKLFPSGKKNPSASTGGTTQVLPIQNTPREQPALDGSKIPKEITFPGSRKSGSLSPDGASDTSQEPQVRGDIQLDVIEFKPGPKPSTTPQGPLKRPEKYRIKK